MSPTASKHYMHHYFGTSPEVRLINHQRAHIAGAFYASGFDEAMCMSYDSYGDRLSGAVAIGNSDGIEILDTMAHDNSLGTFYGTMTIYLGFQGDEDEYKVMGLAAFGEEGVNLSDRPLPIRNAEYNVDIENMCRHVVPNQRSTRPIIVMPWLNISDNRDGFPADQSNNFIATSLCRSKSIGNCVVSLVDKLNEKTGIQSYVVSGGVALNCVANHALLQLPFIDEIFMLSSCY